MPKLWIRLKICRKIKKEYEEKMCKLQEERDVTEIDYS